MILLAVGSGGHKKPDRALFAVKELDKKYQPEALWTTNNPRGVDLAIRQSYVSDDRLVVWQTARHPDKVGSRTLGGQLKSGDFVVVFHQKGSPNGFGHAVVREAKKVPGVEVTEIWEDE